jgi:acyl-homoserine-lactone acylase
LDPAKYPSYFEPGRQLKLRTQMSLAMLEGEQKFSLDDVMRLKFNTTMLLAARVKPDLISALKHESNPSEEVKAGLAVMEAWDNKVLASSRGAILFQRFWDGYGAATPKPFAVAWDSKNPASTPYGLSDPRLAVTKFEEAVTWTRKTYGSESTAWGDVYRIRMGDLDLPGDGGSELYGLFRVVNFSLAHSAKDAGKYVVGVAERGKPYVGGGDGWIMAIEFSRPLKAYSVLAYGETDNPSSRHNSDQVRLFAEHKFKPVWFAEQDIKGNLERAYHPGE